MVESPLLLIDTWHTQPHINRFFWSPCSFFLSFGFLLWHVFMLCHTCTEVWQTLWAIYFQCNLSPEQKWHWGNIRRPESLIKWPPSISNHNHDLTVINPHLRVRLPKIYFGRDCMIVIIYISTILAAGPGHKLATDHAQAHVPSGNRQPTEHISLLKNT